VERRWREWVSLREGEGERERLCVCKSVCMRVRETEREKWSAKSGQSGNCVFCTLLFKWALVLPSASRLRCHPKVAARRSSLERFGWSTSLWIRPSTGNLKIGGIKIEGDCPNKKMIFGVCRPGQEHSCVACSWETRSFTTNYCE
jgi:hypothetical protein